MAGGLLSGLSARECRALLVPAGDADHLRGGGAESPRHFRPWRAGGGRSARRRGLRRASAPIFSVRFLVKYFETKSLKPFAIYCAVAGIAALLLVRL